MRIAIYARKSKSSDKGESIDNQIHLCKEYAATHFDDVEFFIFQDEGFSGGNTKRPQFQILLSELKQRKYDVLMCYRLDRISRNVSDFSSTLDMLNKNDIGFVSIKENFDTTTPMGRAMIHISSVFAQLERETIAERIRDNMMELAKTGRWLGGTPPTGYTAKKVAYTASNGKTKYYSILEINPTTAPTIKLIYEKYLELGSISQVETYLLQHQIKSPRNSYYRSNVIRGILINPVYVTADEMSLSYFKGLSCSLFTELAKPSTLQGLMPYNRFKEGKINKENPKEEWIVAVGEHEPIIDSTTWLKTQELIKRNGGQFAKPVISAPALLSGIMFCKECGSIMRVMNQSVLADGTISYVYRCEGKLKSRGQLCNIKNAHGHVLDWIIIDSLKEMLENKAALVEKLLAEKGKLTLHVNDYATEKAEIEKRIAANKTAIQNLIRKLALLEDDSMTAYIQEQVQTYHIENEQLLEELTVLNKKAYSNSIETINIDLLLESLQSFVENIETGTIHERRELVRKIVKRIEWTGDSANIFIYESKGCDTESA